MVPRIAVSSSSLLTYLRSTGASSSAGPSSWRSARGVSMRWMTAKMPSTRKASAVTISAPAITPGVP